MESDSLLIILKIIVMISFLGIVIFFGTLPIRSKSFKQRPLLRTIGATFAGAIFINVALIHILPESADTLEQHFKNGQDIQVFPLANLLMMVGFLITVFFTKVLSFHSHKDDHIQSVADSDNENIVTLPEPQFQDESSCEEQSDLKSSLLTQQHKKQKDHHHHHHQHNHHKKLSQNDEASSENVSSPVPAVKKRKSSISTKKSFHSHHSHSHIEKNPSLMKEAYILTLAIYFHTIFEGIAIGVQNSISGFLSTAVAIAFHKWADALSMGCHYRTKNVSKKISYILVIGQAILNVLSIGAGWLIAMQGEVVQAIFLSLSAGTFLAISTLQMLGQELHHKKYMKIKYGLMVGGTIFVSAIWFIQNAIFDNNEQ